MIIEAFTDIKEIPLPQREGSIYGNSDLTNTAQIGMGFGTKVFRADEQGIWLGAKKFVDAPFSVDMEGTIVANSLSLGNYLTKAGTGQNLTGQIVIYTGLTPSIVIGDR